MGSSTLACVGLEVTEPGELIRLLRDAGCAAQPAGTFDGVSVMRWQDPSGAALVIGAGRPSGGPGGHLRLDRRGDAR